MAAETLNKHPIALLKSALNTLISNPVILFPFCVIAFVQVLVLEVIFFAPRYPLSVFFEPIITKMEGEVFLHYPFNYILLTKWFQKVQIPIYIVFNSLFIGAAVGVIDLINNDKTVKMRLVLKQALSRYVHLFTAAVISVVLMLGFSKLYGLLVNRAAVIRSTSGIYFLIKRVVLDGAPYFNLFFAVFVTTLFAFVIPIIMIDGKKIFTAIGSNFKNLYRSFWFVFTIIFVSGLLYVPVLLIKTNYRLLDGVLVPEVWGLLTIASVLITLLIDALQYTAITTYYLLKKEL